MSQIAFVGENSIYYWHSLILAGAVCTGLLLFYGAYFREGRALTAAFLAGPIAIVLSVIFARLIHWYFLPDSYNGLWDAMTHLSGTGYALSGAFLGCLVTALSLVGLERNLPLMLDCMSVGGCAAIAIGRLGSFFTAQDRGEILTKATSLPWAYPVANEITGLPEYRFATFFFQAVIAGGIAVALVLLFWKGRERGKCRSGDVTLLFLLGYCASQIVLDSTRYDALRLRINGFISAVQVFCAVTMAAVMGILIFRTWKQTGKKLPCVLGGLTTLFGFAGAGYLEYHVQRHGDQALGSYLAMGLCTALIAAMGVMLWHQTAKASERKPRAPRGYQGRFAKT